MALRVLFSVVSCWLCGVCCALANSPFPIDDYQPNAKEAPKNIKPAAATDKLQTFLNGLILKTEVDRTRLFENDLVRVKWVLQYPNIPSLNIDYKITDYHIPVLPDFVKQRNFIPNEGDTANVKMIKVNGVAYQEKVLLCFYMSPISVGNYSVGKGDVTIQLFNAAGHFIGAPRQLVSPSVPIRVNALTAKPEDFCGGIGQFSVSEEVQPSSNIHVGQSVTYRIRVKGSGNLTYVNVPSVTFPNGVEGYQLKASSNYSYDYESCSGERVFDYVLIPKNDTLLTLPSVSLSYFNTASNAFKTLKTKPVKLNVLPKLPSKADTLEHRADTLNAEKQNAETLEYSERNKTSVSLWWLLAPLVLLLSVVGWLCRKKRVTEVDLEKQYTARLDALLLDGADRTTASQIEKVLKDYIGEKCGAVVSHMVNNRIADVLRDNGVTENVITDVINFFDDCALFAYSPTANSFTYDELVRKARNLVNSIKFENE